MGRRRRKSIKRPRSRREHRLQGFFILQKRDFYIGDTRLPPGGILELLTSLVSPIQESRAHNARAYARRGARARRSNETPGACRGLVWWGTTVRLDELAYSVALMTSARRLYLQVEQSRASTRPGESTTFPCARATAWPPGPFAVACCVIPPDRSVRPSSQSADTLYIEQSSFTTSTVGTRPLRYRSIDGCGMPIERANAAVDWEPFNSLRREKKISIITPFGID